MAAGLGYIEFTTGDILTAASANGYLASQTVMVFADAAARTSAIASPQEGMVSYLKDTNAIEYYSGSAWVAVGGGGAGGKVLQVVNATYSTSTTITSSSYTDTGLSASITPSSATSKVLVLVSQRLSTYRAVGQAGAGYQLLRGATVIVAAPSSPYSLNVLTNSSAAEIGADISFNYLDSPATTSSTTYKVQARPETTANSSNVIAQTQSTPSMITLMEIGA